MTIQATDLRIKVEPFLFAPAVFFGPLDSVSANSVMLTSDNLRKAGSYPPRNGQEWYCKLWVYVTVDGVETLLDMTDYTVAAVYWDNVSKEATSIDCALGGDTGSIVLGIPSTADQVAGMYRFSITGTQVDIFDICGGWIEMLPAIPT